MFNKLTFSITCKVKVYTDACDSPEKKSYPGFLMLMAGEAIAWESRNRYCMVALSTITAEYIALSWGAKENYFSLQYSKRNVFLDDVDFSTKAVFWQLKHNVHGQKTYHAEKKQIY